MANILDLLTRLYDATECLRGDDYCPSSDPDDPDEWCIVCTVGGYLERRCLNVHADALEHDHHATRSALSGLATAAELHCAACGCGSQGERDATKQALETAVTGARVRLGDITIIGRAVQADTDDRPAAEPIDRIADGNEVRAATTVQLRGDAL